MNLLVVILLLNAVFWGLATHSQHCSLGQRLFPNMNCASHLAHLLMGILFFILAVYFRNRSYVNGLLSGA